LVYFSPEIQTHTGSFRKKRRPPTKEVGHDEVTKSRSNAEGQKRARDTYVVQGERITDPVALATLRERGLPDHETVVEIPAALLRFADPVE